MKLTVHRFIFTDKSTMSSVDIDGVFACYGLEPPTLDGDVKPRAIPPGTYTLRLLPSARFGRYTPHVLDVPGFTAIEIHPGNYPQDTHGCLLVGKSRGTEAVFESDQAFNELMAKLDAAQDMSIEYVEERAISA
jgi:hypothetical protein